MTGGTNRIGATTGIRPRRAPMMPATATRGGTCPCRTHWRGATILIPCAGRGSCRRAIGRRTEDEASMERSKSFVKALQEIKNLRLQLYSASEYYEKSYLNTHQKQMLVLRVLASNGKNGIGGYRKIHLQM